MTAADATRSVLEFRDPARARALAHRLAQLVDDGSGESLAVMHVCGSHEQSIARFGLRATFPPTLDVLMGPGCPVCVTDAREIDDAVALARAGVRLLTYGDMLRVPGSDASLDDVRAEGARVEVVYSVLEAVEKAREDPGPVVFFASGFETTAVATAAALLEGPPASFSILCAHKYIPPAMEIVAEMPGSRVRGFLAAGHAATITGWGVFEGFVQRHGLPVVVAGFEPLDILGALVRLVERIQAGDAVVENCFPRCVTREGNRRGQEQLWRVFELVGGSWRGIARIPNGQLRLRTAFAHYDARERFALPRARPTAARTHGLASQCRCGDIMAGLAAPTDCALFGGPCRPDTPVGACMVSSEGTCRIWHEYGSPERQIPA